MAGSLPQRSKGVLAPGVCAALAIASVFAAAAAGLTLAADQFSLRALGEPYVLHALRFTLLQASLSTLISVALGAALALALARRRFFLRGFVLRALGACFVLPAIVAVFGIVALHGRSGWLSSALQYFGLPRASYLYGLPGILLAHCFFNIAFCARAFLGAIETVPAARWRLAECLAFKPADVFWRIDWPVLRQAIPGVAGLVFMLCAASFAIVLALGGGPQSATLEVAIYEALRFDFDVGRAALLSLAQICLGLGALLFIGQFSRRAPDTAALSPDYLRPDGSAPLVRLFDALVFTLCFLLLAAPALAALASGVNAALADVIADEQFRRALLGSLAIAAPAGILAVTLALALGTGVVELSVVRGRTGLAQALSGSAAVILAIPPFALGTGLFVALRPFTEPASIALPLVALVNGLMALPVAARILIPALALTAERHGKLISSLGIEGWNRWRLVEAPLLRRPLGLALATSIAFSLGDLGVAALFGAGDAVTLPLLLYSFLGSYQMERAAGVAFLLSALILLIFAATERLAGGRHELA